MIKESPLPHSQKSDHAGTFPSTFVWAVVSGDQNKKLTTKFSLLEIRTALKSMGRNKAPGLDGFSVEFFIKF